MRLLTKTSLNFISASVIFFLIGSIVMYFSVRNIIAADLENRLLEQQEYFINQADKGKLHALNSDFVFIDPSIEETTSFFSDTVLITNGTYMLYRKLEFSYFDNSKYYRVSILQSQRPSDVLIMKFVIMNVGLAMLFFLIVFFVNRHSIKNALKVFYSTINKLEYFEINNRQELKLDEAEIEEIKKLNNVFKKMSEQIRKDFEAQKQYTENVTHELQTPLAIISSKVDGLMQADNLNKGQMEELALLLETTNRLSKINHSLIFLTKIDNNFYAENLNCLINKVIKEQLDLFDDAIKERNLKLLIDLDNPVEVCMNPYLAETLVVNILKNAIVHNIDEGNLIITVIDRCLFISNSGNLLPFNSADIFNRFIRSKNNKSLGVGLSIAKRICDIYGFIIEYRFDKSHIFTIKF